MNDSPADRAASPPAEFIDFEETQSRWFVPLVAVSVAFALGAAIIIAMAISRTSLAPSLPFVFVILLVALLLVFRFTLPDRLTAKVRTKPEASLNQLLHILFSSPWRFPGQDLRKVMRALAAQGRQNVVARVARAANRPQIHPLIELFEPVPVDESVPLFVALSREDNQGATDDGLPDADLDKRQATRKLKRNMALAGGVGMILLFGLNALMAAFDSWRNKRIHPNLILWTAWFAIAILGLGGRGAWSWKQQWMLVPGGIASRRSRMFRSATELHLFRRTESVLIAQAGHQKLWTVHVADKDASQMARMTPREAHLLLRAWLSPIPPPPIERLSDLQ